MTDVVRCIQPFDYALMIYWPASYPVNPRIVEVPFTLKKDFY